MELYTILKESVLAAKAKLTQDQESILMAEKAVREHPKYQEEIQSLRVENIRKLVASLACFWSCGTVSVWLLVGEEFEKHLTEPPRMHREFQLQNNGYYSEMTFVRWKWDDKYVTWIEDHDGGGYFGTVRDIEHKPSPQFLLPLEHPIYAALPKRRVETGRTGCCELENILTRTIVTPTDEEHAANIEVNVGLAVACADSKARISTLEDAENILRHLEPKMWILFLCWLPDNEHPLITV
jgi:hypothetical protein